MGSFYYKYNLNTDFKVFEYEIIFPKFLYAFVSLYEFKLLSQDPNLLE